MILSQPSAGTYPNVPSPSFPRNSKSRIFEHPLNRVLPFLFLSRDDATISSYSLLFARTARIVIRYKDRAASSVFRETAEGLGMS